MKWPKPNLLAGREVCAGFRLRAVPPTTAADEGPSIVVSSHQPVEVSLVPIKSATDTCTSLGAAASLGRFGCVRSRHYASRDELLACLDHLLETAGIRRS